MINFLIKSDFRYVLHSWKFNYQIMFVKKDLNEEELKEKRNQLATSLHRAENTRDAITQSKIRSKDKMKKVDDTMGDKNTDITKRSNGNDALTENISCFMAEISESQTVEKFQNFMKKEDTVLKAAEIVTFLEKNCVNEDYSLIQSRPKVFMSLMLLARFPEEVMPDASMEERKILDLSQDFYESINDFTSKSAKYSVARHKEISWKWIGAINMFDEWFVKDKKILFEKMKTDFMTWTKTIGNLKFNDVSRSEWEPNAIRYQNEILKRMLEIFGKEQLQILSDEVNEMNEQFKDSEFHINFDPIDCKWRQKNMPLKASEEDESAIIEKLRAVNIQILHELMIKENNLDFEGILNLSGKSMKNISEANRATLLMLISSLGNDTGSEQIALALQEIFRLICVSLNNLAGDNDDYCQEIQLIDCSIDSNNWIVDACSLLTWVVGMCKKCCAPVRDQSCKELEMSIKKICDISESSELIILFTNTFTVLFDLLNSMRCDFCNFRLRCLVTEIDGKGIAEKYELEEIKKKFSSSFDITKKWLNSKPNSETKLADMYLNFFDPATDAKTESDIPETFYLDFDRVSRYREELLIYLVRESAMIYFKNYSRASKEDSTRKEEILLDLNTRLGEAKTFDELEETFMISIGKISGKDALFLAGNIKRLFKSPVEDKVLLLLKNREMSKIRLSLTSEQTMKTNDLTGKIGALYRYNKACYNSIYDEIILKKEKDNQ